ncbi:TetR/AcrR family transcriptional regulator [Kitasatospora cheerisanensis]|uniref:TetR/AcrR family transcriptional regulator n=1 Tax=Kitasatospora cheerisanensis TaxID=81942 RepID=UPI0009FF2D4A|nr:TetR/AcrR family transcriptional regulator [Kitasatospora cheerisanensis]
MKQTRAQRTHERVLDAAAHEFALHGYQSAKLHDVITRTGMTKGALYAHFPSKHHLATALVDDTAAHWQQPPAPAALTHLLHDLVTRLHTDPRFRAALRLTVDPDWTPDRPPVLYHRLHHHLTTAIRAGHPATPRPPHTHAHLILAVLHGTTRLSPAPAPHHIHHTTRILHATLHTTRPPAPD